MSTSHVIQYLSNISVAFCLILINKSHNLDSGESLH